MSEWEFKPAPKSLAIVTVPQAAEELGASEWEIRKLIESGELPSFRYMSSQKRIRRVDLKLVADRFRESSAAVGADEGTDRADAAEVPADAARADPPPLPWSKRVATDVAAERLDATVDEVLELVATGDLPPFPWREEPSFDRAARTLRIRRRLEERHARA